ncbi:HYC_CC_PP family protein [Halocola ammonii]
MRKVISISFAALYTLLAMGIQLHMHFCHDELRNVSFFQQVDSCCASESSESCELESKCCEFAQVEFALEDEHQPAFKFNVDQFFFLDYQTFFALVQEVNPLDFSIQHEQLRGPPERLYLLNCAFTFYG